MISAGNSSGRPRVFVGTTPATTVVNVRVSAPEAEAYLSKVICVALAGVRYRDLAAKISNTQAAIKSLENDINTSRQNWLNSNCGGSEPTECNPSSNLNS